ncbi:sigma-54-dependent transcriptional regulator [Acidobacteriota bacterium]
MRSKPTKKILVVDDEEAMRWALKKALENKGFEVTTLDSGDKAVKEAARKRYAVVLMDIKMPGMDGIEALQRIRQENSEQFVILMTAYGTMKTAIDAMKEGAFDYVIKPFDPNELYAIIEKAISVGQYSEEVRYLSAELSEKPTFGNIIGRSQAMQAVYKVIGQVASSDVTLLIRGESGTGKELIAHAIHHFSPRVDKPFVVVNVAAIPSNLLESELFGHEKGSFTGALSTTIGKFELANNGTVFLDEIGDMDFICQSKLLRVLQEREFYRVGGIQPIRVDVRIIAATNKDIDKALKEGDFRADLYHRLSAMPIGMPPLRKRKEDIHLLIDYFLSRFEGELDMPRKYLSKEVIDLLRRHDWPGNVRELENTLKRAMVLAPTSIILPEHLPKEVLEGVAKREPVLERLESKINDRVAGYIASLESNEKGDLYAGLLRTFERPLIEEALRRAHFNKKKAAELIGINRNTLNKKIKDLNIQAEPQAAKKVSSTEKKPTPAKKKKPKKKQ